MTKALTALYALETLGADHRFATRILATGPVVDGVLQGDLILAGGGDPGLDSDQLGDLAQRLVEAGLRGITGVFLVWDGALPAFEQISAAQQPHLSYNPAIGGLNLNYNRVHFEWAREASSYVVTMQARAARYSPDVHSAQMRVIDRSMPIYTYAEADQIDEWTVARGALGTAGSRWLPVRHPALYAGETFSLIAASMGLELGAAQPVATLPVWHYELARNESPPLADIVQAMLRYSTNLTAEVIGLAASRARGLEPASLQVSSAMMNLWLRDTYGVRVRLVDHSGLSDRSYVTAAAMAKVLLAPQTGAVLRPLLKQITLLDQSGNRLVEPPAVVQAKTGTLNFVSALSGYARTIGAADLAFAIFCSNPEMREVAKLSDADRPEGAAAWNGRAKRLQQRMLQHWGRVLS